MAGTSRIDLTPEQTTAIGVSASAWRSADSSNVLPASRWTPPSPPVAKTAMPQRAARKAVLATVVAPVRPLATATRQVPQAQLDGVVGKGDAFQQRCIQPHVHSALDDADRRRHGALAPDRLLDLRRDLAGSAAGAARG